MAIAVLFIVFAVLLVIGVPVAFALAAASLATLLYLDLPSVVMVQQIYAGTGSASLIAIPLFIFAGEIMMRGGISERLIALASSLVGRLRGGLGVRRRDPRGRRPARAVRDHRALSRSAVSVSRASAAA